MQVEHGDTQHEIAKKKQAEMLKQREMAKRMFGAGSGFLGSDAAKIAAAIFALFALVAFVTFVTLSATGALRGPLADSSNAAVGKVFGMGGGSGAGGVAGGGQIEEIAGSIGGGGGGGGESVVSSIPAEL